MGVASSEGVIVWTETLRGDSQAHFIEDFHQATITAGWGSEAISGGYKYTLASKQDLGCKVKLTTLADFGSSIIAFQFLSLDETLAGYQHRARVFPGRRFQLHMNRCQMFLSVYGIANTDSFDYTAVQGGIPFVPRDQLGRCGEDIGPNLTTEAWWSNGDTEGSGRGNFRNARKGDRAWSACHNGDLIRSDVTAYADISRLRLVPVAIALPIDSYFGQPTSIQRTRRVNGDPLLLNPMLQWGSSAYGSIAPVRGEIYDAIECSLDRSLDEKRTLCDSIECVNYMQDSGGNTRTYFNSLYLMLGIAPEAAKRGPYVY